MFHRWETEAVKLSNLSKVTQLENGRESNTPKGANEFISWKEQN